MTQNKDIKNEIFLCSHCETGKKTSHWIGQVCFAVILLVCTTVNVICIHPFEKASLK